MGKHLYLLIISFCIISCCNLPIVDCPRYYNYKCISKDCLDNDYALLYSDSNFNLKLSIDFYNYFLEKDSIQYIVKINLIQNNKKFELHEIFEELNMVLEINNNSYYGVHLSNSMIQENEILNHTWYIQFHFNRADLRRFHKHTISARQKPIESKEQLIYLSPSQFKIVISNKLLKK